MSDIRELGDALAAAVFALLTAGDSPSGSLSDSSGQSGQSGSPAALSPAALSFSFLETFDGTLTGVLQMAVTLGLVEGSADSRSSAQGQFHYAIHTFMAFDHDPTMDEQDALVVFQEKIVRALPKMSCVLPDHSAAKPRLEAFAPVDGEELLTGVVHGMIGIVFFGSY
ncbi:MAG: hypothetical protein WCV67_03090 [Victivallaceae bacterium]|jgi:hypothetical protein